MTLAIVAGLTGLVLGWVVFAVLATALERLKRPFRGLERACERKFWVDELYREIVLKPAYGLAAFLAFLDGRAVDGLVNAVGRGGRRTATASGWADARGVDGAVRGVGWSALSGGGVVSRLQSGRVRLYLSVAVGVVAAILVLQRIL